MSADRLGGPAPRLRCLVPRDRGSPAYIHRWLGFDFTHEYGPLGNRVCQCQPHFIHPTDRRSMDEIMDDLDDAEEWEALH